MNNANHLIVSVRSIFELVRPRFQENCFSSNAASSHVLQKQQINTYRIDCSRELIDFRKSTWKILNPILNRRFSKYK